MTHNTQNNHGRMQWHQDSNNEAQNIMKSKKIPSSQISKNRNLRKSTPKTNNRTQDYAKQTLSNQT